MGQGPSWAVMAQVSEPAPLVLAFVAHHLGLGAAHVYLFLDTPDPALVEMLSTEPRCIPIPAHREVWNSLHACDWTPRAIRRQRANHALAYASAEEAWLLHLDADEFLRADRPVAEILAEVPAEIDWLWLHNLERVYRHGKPPQTLFEGLFRRPLASPAEAAQIYGPAAAYLTLGLCGYVVGKSLTRTGRGLVHNIHWPVGSDENTRADLPHLRPADLEVLHFDGLTPRHWLFKLARAAGLPNAQLRAPSRRAQFARIRADAGKPAALLAFHDAVKGIDPAQEAQLTALGALDTRPFDPAPALRAVFPGIAADLGVAGFDAHVARMAARLSPAPP